MFVKAVFPVQGAEIPLDHGYALYSSLSRLPPPFMETATSRSADPGHTFRPGPSQRLAAFKTLNCRPAQLASRVVHAFGEGAGSLAISRFCSDAWKSRKSLPARALVPAWWSSPLMRRPLKKDSWKRPDGVSQRLASTPSRSSANAESSRSKGLRVGYGLRFDHLSPSDSLKFQTTGLGGHRRFGCGVFTPVLNAKVKE